MTRRPKLLDLFSGAGGAGMGYYRAGFDVTGVDLHPQPNYPFEFHQGDALTVPLYGYDVIHVSPPCQAYTAMNALTLARNKTRKRALPPKLIDPIRARLKACGTPYVIENVIGAPVRPDLLLCGSMFGLRVRRHRIFEMSMFPLLSMLCRHDEQRDVIGVFGDHPDPPRPYRTNCAVSVQNARDAMGIDWMTWLELCESIPPSYTQYIGEWMIRELKLQETEKQHGAFQHLSR